MRRNRKNPPDEEARELGFGNKLTDTTSRLINKDGSFNVVRSGRRTARFSPDLYHRFITMSWGRFFASVFGFFFVVNALFACLYLCIGMEQFQGVGGKSGLGLFWDAYFFSTQTFTTVGYGYIAPVGWLASMVASLESVAGWLTFAIATGLLYGRFARPVSRILYSRHLLMAPYQGHAGLMFRIVNARDSQLIEVETEVIFTHIGREGAGAPRRRYYRLPLERDRINLLSLSWTLVHPVTEESPLYGLTADDLAASDAEFWVFIKAFDDTFAQVVYKRSSYSYHDLSWGVRFVPMYGPVAGSTRIGLDLDKLDDTEPAPLPVPVPENE